MDRVKNGHGIKVREKDGVLYSGGDTILAADDVSGICAILDGVRRTLLQGIPIRALKLPSPSVKKPAFLVVRPWIFRFSELLLLCPGQSRSFGAARQWGPGHVRFAIHVKGKPAHAGNEPEMASMRPIFSVTSWIPCPMGA